MRFQITSVMLWLAVLGTTVADERAVKILQNGFQQGINLFDEITKFEFNPSEANAARVRFYFAVIGSSHRRAGDVLFSLSTCGVPADTFKQVVLKFKEDQIRLLDIACQLPQKYRDQFAGLVGKYQEGQASFVRDFAAVPLCLNYREGVANDATLDDEAAANLTLALQAPCDGPVR